ncbi:MAG: transposase [Ruminococcaceae bacterium]|nr:transposase [Oscillospiraceae bacterium]
MLNKEIETRRQSEIICVEDLVPQDYLLRKIEAAVDFSKIYDIVGKLYSTNNGRPSTDPVVLFKAVLIQHMYGIPSLRKTAEEISLNMAYRWFLGYSLLEKTPHFSTFSYNFCHRFTNEVVQQVFDWILNEINNAGYLSPEAVFIDGAHIKANNNIRKVIKKAVPEAAKYTANSYLKK